jgi:glutathione S-transferase
MTLALYGHPLSSFVQKALVAFYENETPFEFRMVDLDDPSGSAEFKSLWPIAKMPVLRDEARERTVPETSIIIEYLDQHYPGRTRFIPADPDAARQMRLRDRFFDLYVQQPMQKVITDRLRPEGSHDAFGVEEARGVLATALGLVDEEMAGRSDWIMGEAFTMADCAAAPALFYADKVIALKDAYPNAAAYHARLSARPSYARARTEAEPYLQFMPQ